MSYKARMAAQLEAREDSEIERIGYSALQMYEHQTPATLNQAAPVQDTWYELLPETKNVRIYVLCLNIEDTDELIQARLTVNGVAHISLAGTFSHSTNYVTYKTASATAKIFFFQIDGTTIGSRTLGFLIDGATVKIEIRKTTANGAGNLTAICAYGVLKNVR